MKKAAQILWDIIPNEIRVRLDGQPDDVTEYATPGFSLSLLQRPNDRLNIAKKRVALAQEGAVKQNLTEIIDLLEVAATRGNCPVWGRAGGGQGQTLKSE